jgi:hypothetical protein
MKYHGHRLSTGARGVELRLIEWNLSGQSQARE